jgi:general secretion pathway protein G
LIENLQTRDERRWTCTKSVRGKSRRQTRGFTLLELIIVMAIIAILLEIAIPIYSRSILAARERALRTDLASLRQAIWRYTLDKQRGPQGLDDLRAAGYISEIPKDPMAKDESNATGWEVESPQENVLLSPDQQDPGITDVHSASNQIGSDGTAYSTW